MPSPLPLSLQPHKGVYRRISARYSQALIDGDVTLVTGTIEHKADLFMLNTVTQFFEKALSPPFVESSSRRIQFDDHNPWTIRRFLYYVYNGTYFSEGRSGFTCKCFDNPGDTGRLKDTGKSEVAEDSDDPDYRCNSEGSDCEDDGYWEEDDYWEETNNPEKTNDSVDPGSSEDMTSGERKTIREYHTAECCGTDVTPGLRHIELYRLADMLNIDELKDRVCNNIYSTRIRPSEDIDEFLDIIVRVYTVTAERDKLIRELYIEKLITEFDLVCDNPDFIKLTRDPNMVEFASDLAFALANDAKAVRIAMMDLEEELKD